MGTDLPRVKSAARLSTQHIKDESNNITINFRSPYLQCGDCDKSCQLREANHAPSRRSK